MIDIDSEFVTKVLDYDGLEIATQADGWVIRLGKNSPAGVSSRFLIAWCDDLDAAKFLAEAIKVTVLAARQLRDQEATS